MSVGRWQTRLKPTEKFLMEVELATISMYSEWIVTDFAKNLKGEFMYIVQPLIDQGGQEGVTGVSAHILTKTEMEDLFEVV